MPQPTGAASEVKCKRAESPVCGTPPAEGDEYEGQYDQGCYHGDGELRRAD